MNSSSSRPSMTDDNELLTVLRNLKIISSTGKKLPISELQLLRTIHGITKWVKMILVEIVLPATSLCQTELLSQRRTKKSRPAELILGGHSSSHYSGRGIFTDGDKPDRNKALSDALLSCHSSGSVSPETKLDIVKLHADITAESIFSAMVEMIGSLFGNTAAARFILKQKSVVDITVLREQLNKFIKLRSTHPFTKNLTGCLYGLISYGSMWISHSDIVLKNTTARGEFLQWEFLKDLPSSFTDEAIHKLLHSSLRVTYAAPLSKDEKKAVGHLCGAVTKIVKNRIAVTCGNTHQTTIQSGPQPSVFLDEVGRTYLHGVRPDKVTQERRQSKPKYLLEDARQFRTVNLRVIQTISEELLKRLGNTCCMDFSKYRGPLVDQLLEELENLAVKVSDRGGRLSAAEDNATSVITSGAHDRLVMANWLIQVPQCKQTVVCYMASTVIEVFATYFMIDMTPSGPSSVFDIHTVDNADTTMKSSLPSEEDSFNFVSESELNLSTAQPWTLERASFDTSSSTCSSACSGFNPSEIEELHGGSELNIYEELNASERSSSGGRPETYLVIREEYAQEGCDDSPPSSSLHASEEKIVNIAACSDGPQPSVFLDEVGRAYLHGVRPDKVTQERRQSKPKYQLEDVRQFRTVNLRVIQTISEELLKRLGNTCCMDFSKYRGPLVDQLLEELENLAVKVSDRGGRLSAAEDNAASVIASGAHDRLVMAYWLIQVPQCDQAVVCYMASTVIEVFATYFMIDMTPSGPSSVFDIHTVDNADTTMKSSSPSEEDSFNFVSESELNLSTAQPWTLKRASFDTSSSTCSSACSGFNPSELHGGTELNIDEELNAFERSRSGGRPGTYLVIREESAQEGCDDSPPSSSLHASEEKIVNIAACSEDIKDKTSSPKKKQRLLSRMSSFLAKFCCFGCTSRR